MLYSGKDSPRCRDRAIDNKTKILEAATDLFLAGGARALSVRAIASQAGVSTIGIYSHFQGKQGILDALYIEGFELVSQAMAEASEDLALTARERVLASCRRYLHLAERFEAHYRLIFGEHGGDYVPSAAAGKVAIRAFRQLTVVVAQLLPETASEQQRQDAAIAIWAQLHGYVSLRHQAMSGLTDRDDWQAKALAAVAVLINGIS